MDTLFFIHMSLDQHGAHEITKYMMLHWGSRHRRHGWNQSSS